MKSFLLTAKDYELLYNAVNFQNPTIIASSNDDSYGVGNLLIIELKDVVCLTRKGDGLWIEFKDTESEDVVVGVPIFDFILVDKH